MNLRHLLGYSLLVVALLWASFFAYLLLRQKMHPPIILPTLHPPIIGFLPTETHSPTASPTNTPTPTPSPSATLTLEPSITASITFTSTITITPTIPTQTPTFTPSATLIGSPTLTLTPAPGGSEAQLQHVPILSNVIPERIQEIFAAGQTMGNQPNGLAKVGDCNTESKGFLQAFDTGRYDLGDYDYLQDTVEYFQGDFNRPSVAGHSGFNTATVQDSFWVDSPECRSNESALQCEYRVMNPSVALIMFGANDINVFDEDTYQKYLREIIEYTLDQGIIPVLTTIPRRPDNLVWQTMINFNMRIVHLAWEYEIPLINFWLAAQYLPDAGLYDDNAHLTADTFNLYFTGNETEEGHTLRSLLTLQMLDLIRQEIIK